VSEQADDRAQEPSVSTAPAHSRWRNLPSHLGRARTSTLVLGFLFLAIGALYLNVRPPPTVTAPAGGGSSVEQPVEPTATVVPTTTTPAEPTTTTPAEPTSTEPTSAEPTSTEPTEPSTPSRTTSRSPTPTGSPEPVPTTSAPTG
jgi:hypothetical protein